MGAILIHGDRLRTSVAFDMSGCVQMRNRQLEGSHRLRPTPLATQTGMVPIAESGRPGFFNPKIVLRGFLFTMADPTVNTATSLKIRRQTYTKQVFNTVIPRNVDIRDTHFARNISFRLTPALKQLARTTNSLMSCFLAYEKDV